MKKFKLSIKNLTILTTIFFFYGCGVKDKNDDFDLSGLKIPQKENKFEEIAKSKPTKPVINKLNPLKANEDILLNVKKGRENPFLPTNKDSKKFISNLKLKGFISLNDKDYALVEFQKEEGIISNDSVGGLNTNLLPTGAVVKNVDPINQKINLFLDETNYILDLIEN